MKNKHIKLYEEIQLEALGLMIYEASIKRYNVSLRLNEQKEWDDDEQDEMTSGERRAFERGLQVMTKPQMAALYLLAKGRSEDLGADYMKLIDGIEEFGYTDETDGSFNITIPALADAIGMDSDRTLSYTQRKFQNMMGGLGETASQSLSPKLIEAYAALSQKDDTTIAAFAAGCIQDASNTTNRDSADSRREEANAKATTRTNVLKEKKAAITREVHHLVKDFKSDGRLSIGQYSNIIWGKTRDKYPDINMSSIYELYVKYLADANLPLALHINKPRVA